MRSVSMGHGVMDGKSIKRRTYSLWQWERTPFRLFYSRTSLPGQKTKASSISTHPTLVVPTMKKKLKKQPNHHHVFVTKSCLKRQGEIEEETSHSSFSHGCGGGGGEEEEDTSFDVLFFASPEDVALMKPMITKKKVAFSGKATRKATLAISEYTQDEIFKSWYSRHELSNILDDYQRSLGQGPSPSPNEMTTGLFAAVAAAFSSEPRDRGADRHKYLTTQADAERMGLTRSTTSTFQYKKVNDLQKVDTNEDQAEGEDGKRNDESSPEECNNVSSGSSSGRRCKFLFVDRFMRLTVRPQQ